MLRKQNWVLLCVLLMSAFSSVSQAGFIHPSLYDGTYQLSCNDMEVVVFGNLSGPNGLDVKYTQSVPLLCGNSPAQKVAFENAMDKILQQIVTTCDQFEVLSNMIDCKVEAGKMVDAIVNSNLLLIDIVPDQVEFKAIYPNAFNWYLGLGYTTTVSQWLDSSNNIINEQSRIFLLNNNSGSFINVDLPLANLLQVIPGCVMLGGGSISGKLSLDYLYDNDSQTKDINSNLKSDASITCARKLSNQWYSATIGMKFRGSVGGVRIY